MPSSPLARSCLLAVVLATVTWATAVRAQGTEDEPGAEVAAETGDTTGDSEDVPDAETPPAETPRDRARALYREGEAAYKAGRYLEAVSKFKQAARHEPNPALSYNIALAYDAVGEVPEALHWYRDYLRGLPQAPDRDEVRASIRRLEGRLQNLGVQQVSIMSEPDGATVVLDDEVVGTTPWTGQTTPGVHRARLTLPGYAPSTVEFTLAEDRAVDVRLVLTRGSAPTRSATDRPTPTTNEVAQPPAEHDESPRRVKARSWVLLGGGAGLLGTALGFEAARSGAEQDARDTEIQIEARESIDKMRRYESTARIFAVVGGAVAVVGGLSLVYDLRSSRPRHARITPEVACAPDSCWLTARGRF